MTNKALITVLVLLGGLSLGCRRGYEPANRPRNAVLVVIDTLRQDRVSAYGATDRRLTPVIDQLAAAGAMADGLAPSSWTRPTMATLFTGLQPLRHQVAVKTDRIPDSLPTLAETLRAAGFTTLGITTNGHVSAAWGFDRGFDELVATWRHGLGHDAAAREVNRLLEPRLATLRAPYFLYVHYLDPHQPYNPPFGWDGGPLPEALAALAPLAEGPLLRGAGGTPPEVLAAAAELYDGEVRFVDAALGELLDMLARRGLDEDTLVIVTSDHGEELGEHGRVGHGKSLYEEVVRVPLVFHSPGVVQPGSRLGLFPLESLFPTLLDLLDASRRRGPALDGPSFAAALTGRGEEPKLGSRLLYLEGNPDAGLALLTDGWKLVLHLHPYRKQLFHLPEDPHEQRDRTEHGLRFERLAADLAATYDLALRSALPRQSTTADAELSAQLAALGYGGAHRPEFARRVFPRRLAAADPRPGGPRGWENIQDFRACGSFVDDPAQQFLSGWYGLSPGETGRWSEPGATMGVAVPANLPEGAGLKLEGTSWRRRKATLQVVVEGARDHAVSIAPGPFEVFVPLDSIVTGKRWLLVRLVVDPPFYPREEGHPDDRVLGLFFTRYCLEAR